MGKADKQPGRPTTTACQLKPQCPTLRAAAARSKTNTVDRRCEFFGRTFCGKINIFLQVVSWPHVAHGPLSLIRPYVDDELIFTPALSEQKHLHQLNGCQFQGQRR